MKRAVLYTPSFLCDQNPEAQALDLRRLAEQRGFEISPRAYRPYQRRQCDAKPIKDRVNCLEILSRRRPRRR